MVANLASRDFCCKHLEIVDLVNASGTILDRATSTDGGPFDAHCSLPKNGRTERQTTWLAKSIISRWLIAVFGSKEILVDPQNPWTSSGQTFKILKHKSLCLLSLIDKVGKNRDRIMLLTFLLSD